MHFLNKLTKMQFLLLKIQITMEVMFVYSVLIADDEIFIREGLEKIISALNPAFEVVKIFENGNALIEYIKENSADVIISDIRMPNGTGLDIAKYVYENKLDIKVVLISGYKEFEYAHEAIHYNVAEYLLKPTKTEQIKTILNNIKNELDLKKRLNGCEPVSPVEVSEEQIYFDAVNGSLSEQKLRSLLNKIKKDEKIDEKPCAIISISILNYRKFINEKWQYFEDDFKMAVINILKSDNKQIYCSNLCNNEGEYNLFIISRVICDVYQFEKTVEAHLSFILKNIKELFGLESRGAIKNLYSNIFLVEKNNIKDVFQKNNQREMYKLISSNIAMGNVEETMKLVDEFVDNIENFSTEEIRRAIYDMITALILSFDNNNFKIDRKFDEYFTLKKITDFSCKNIQELRLWLKDIFTKLTKECETDKNDYTRIIIQKAIDYINEHYSEPITLDIVADHVYLNSVYFSRVFKQYTGERFTDYVIKVRMEAAIELLKKKKYKVYEISEKVGIGSVKYFFRLFKKHTGYAPKEYHAYLLKFGDEDEKK